MADRGLPDLLETGVAAASRKARATSMAAGAAAIRQGAAADAAGARRLHTEASAILDLAYASPVKGDFGRLRSLLTLAVLTARNGERLSRRERP